MICPAGDRSERLPKFPFRSRIGGVPQGQGVDRSPDPTARRWCLHAAERGGFDRETAARYHILPIRSQACPIMGHYRTSFSPDTSGALTQKKRAKAPRRARLQHDSRAKPRTWNIPTGAGAKPVSGLGAPRHLARRSRGRRPFGRSGFYRRRRACCPECPRPRRRPLVRRRGAAASPSKPPPPAPA